MIYSQFWENGRKAEVVQENGVWGAIFYEDGAKVEQRMFEGQVKHMQNLPQRTGFYELFNNGIF